MYDAFWSDKLNKNYVGQQWVSQPSLFAQYALPYFDKDTKILELGAGLGQDSVWFARNRLNVLSTDFSEFGIEYMRQQKKDLHLASIDFERLDIAQQFRFEDATFGGVYAHLSLHYFDEATTTQIYEEVYRVLKPSGIFAFLVNSIDDPEYGTGEIIEDDFYETEGIKKRFFTTETAKSFSKQFDVIVCDSQGETYKDSAKGIHNLIRFVGKKSL